MNQIFETTDLQLHADLADLLELLSISLTNPTRNLAAALVDGSYFSDLLDCADGVSSLLDCDGILPHGLTAHSRTDGEHTYLFVENYDDQQTYQVQLRKAMTDMESGETVSTLTLPPYGLAVLKSK